MWSWIRSPLKGKGLPGLDGIRKRKWSDLFGDNDDSESKGHQTKVQMTCGVHGTTADLSRLVPYMTLLGIVAASFISIVDIFTHVIFEARKRVSVDITHGAVGYVIYVSSGVLLCLLSTLVCQQWSKEAEGSGLPQMKSIMSGFHDKLRNSLAVEALAAKAVGLICAIGGGLPVGWEGPNVHMSCIIAEYLSRIPYFHSLRQDKALRLQMMACACTVGLASSFGTPIGAVLYALESTSSFYLVPTFWKSILATISGAMVFDIWYKTPVAEAFENTTFGPDDYRRSQLILFCLLGTFMGIVGAFFVKCTHEVYQFRKRRLTYLSNRFVLVGVVALVSGLAQYNNELLRIDPRKAINELFSSNAMQLMTYSDVMFLLLIKFPLIAVCVGLPIPGGVFISSFLMGAGCGRLYGEFLRTVFGPSIVPGLYAVVGAASLAGGVTRALSCSVLIFEVTGQISHMMPILVAVLLSVTVANSFNQSLYDTLIVMKNLPYMPNIRGDVFLSQRVSEVMVKDVVTVKERSSPEEIGTLLMEYPTFSSFPVVSERRSILGVIRASQLRLLISESPATPEKLNPGAEGLPEGSYIQDESLRSQKTAPKPVGVERKSSEKRSREILIVPELSPLEVGDNMTVGQLHNMFVMLMPTHAFVVSRGELVGLVRRGDIIQNVGDIGS